MNIQGIIEKDKLTFNIRNFFIGLSYIVVIILIILKNNLQMDISMQMVTAISIFNFIICRKGEEIEFLIFLLPFSTSIPINFIIIANWIILIFKNIKQISINKDIIPSILIVVLEVISIIDSRSSLSTIIDFIMPFLYTSFVLLCYRKAVNYARILKVFIISVIFTDLIYIIATFQKYDISLFVTFKYRLGTLYYDDVKYLLNINANDLGLYNIFAISIALLLIDKKKIKYIFFAFSMLILTITGILTISRAFFITYVLLIIGYLIIKKIKITTILAIFFAFLIITLIGILAIPNLLNGIYANFVERFSEEEIFGGRGSILAEYFEKMGESIHNTLIGVGISNYAEKYDMSLKSHNATQEIIIAWGILGLFFIVMTHIEFFKAMKQKVQHKIEPIMIMPLVTLLFMIQSLQFYSQGDRILLLIVAYWSIVVMEKQEINDNAIIDKGDKSERKVYS